ncbi:MAG: Mrp/NBP35 family ATP-binding protein [Peptococcaceae bacterium]|jgi:Mrp family chromosome partitioning ATPase|nr:Mrp/NBP35 family ATP-binding protein [Peptococcaceae bacterium]
MSEKTETFVTETSGIEAKLAPNEDSAIRRVVGVCGGKGGVGKSMITAMLAVLARRDGYNTGILDADVTGPAIPKILGIRGKTDYSEAGVFPKQSEERIHVMSTHLVTDQEEEPIAWRGRMLAEVAQQFWTDVSWGDLAYLFIDLPSGTSDVPLTVFQTIPLDGVVLVTTPQELAQYIGRKTYRMAEKMEIPILGIIENMSYVQVPGRTEPYRIFGESRIEELAAELGSEVLGRIPLDPDLARLCDRGRLELMENHYLDQAYAKIIARLG